MSQGEIENTAGEKARDLILSKRLNEASWGLLQNCATLKTVFPFKGFGEYQELL